MTLPTADDVGPFRCTVASAGRAEPLFATASRVFRWLLVEQPGPWGPESVPAARMPPVARATVTRLAADLGARLLLIRRPAVVPARPGVQLYIADSRPGHESLAALHLDDAAALGSVVRPGQDPRWRSVDQPLFLVCTHGRHDPCCALFGRPVAAAFAGVVPEGTWETSHVGGDRFGANVVVLPVGLYLGRLTPADAAGVVTRVRDGRVPVDHLRGRSSLSLPVQAAQHFAREAAARTATGVPDRMSDLLPRVEQALGTDAWRVVLDSTAGPLTVDVRRVAGDQPHRLTCHAAQAQRFPTFVVDGIEPAA